jgi:hypothetical protein
MLLISGWRKVQGGGGLQLPRPVLRNSLSSFPVIAFYFLNDSPPDTLLLLFLAR